MSQNPDAKSVRKLRLAEALRKNLGQRKLQERRREPLLRQPKATDPVTVLQAGAVKDES